MRLAAKLQAMINAAQRRIAGLQREIGAGRDNTGRKTRQLQRLELYEFVVKRLNRGDSRGGPRGRQPGRSR